MSEADMQNDVENWSEEDSAVYRRIAEIAVPSREEQMAALLCLLPYSKSDAFRIVDLGCGEGVLDFAALTAFPMASALALDGSASMRKHAETLLRPFSVRAEVQRFALDSTNWFSYLEDADCIVSSLVVHHLTDAGKRRLFREAYARLNKGGALMLIDVVLPRRDEGVRLYADAYDKAARQQSIARTGDTALFDEFVEEKWNIHRHPEATEMLAPLPHQLTWLTDAGFEGVDCFWLQAGYAVFGGYKGESKGGTQDQLSLRDAMDAVNTAIKKNQNLMRLSDTYRDNEV